MGGSRHLGSKDDLGRGRVNVHVPVLYQQVLTYLAVRPGAIYVDGTVGGGGHARAILEAIAPGGRLLGLDRDPAALAVAERQLASFGERVLLRHGSFARLAALVDEVAPVDGVLLDLGLSSNQLADPARGFAFSLEGPLDMRMDQTEEVATAADLVNGLSVKELSDLLYRYGEERQARRIAAAIVAARPLRTTAELAAVVEGAEEKPVILLLLLRRKILLQVL